MRAHGVLRLLCLILALSGCTRNSGDKISGEDSLKIVEGIIQHRASVDSSFRSDPTSPFNQDSSVVFTGIRWYPPNVQFYFSSMLYRYPLVEEVKVLGTKGEERNYSRYGFFKIMHAGKEYRINAYKFSPKDREKYEQYKKYLSVWFTDLTTGKETYHVGRYIDLGEEDPNRAHIYTIDFNKAYNPYCAYSARYSCAVPLREDNLPIEIRAGEKKYHD